MSILKFDLTCQIFPQTKNEFDPVKCIFDPSAFTHNAKRSRGHFTQDRFAILCRASVSVREFVTESVDNHPRIRSNPLTAHPLRDRL